MRSRAGADRRVLMVPNQFQGSVDQYYHFLLGYLCPITRWLQRHPGTPIAVRHCGPMMPWIELLPPRTDVKVVPAGTMLTRDGGHRQPRVVLPPLDNPLVFRRDYLSGFADEIRRTAGVSLPTSPTGVVVLRRASADPYYCLLYTSRCV